MSIYLNVSDQNEAFFSYEKLNYHFSFENRSCTITKACGHAKAYNRMDVH